MSSQDRRAAARRRAWGRGPCILRFEPLEGRRLLASAVIGASPDLLATQFNTVHSADWGDLIHATGTIANQGTTTTTAPVEVDIYASTTQALTAPGAITSLLGSVLVPAGLQPGASYNFDQIVNLPPSTISGPSPTQSLFVTLKVDPHSNVPEANTLDKQARGLGLDTSVLTVTAHQQANLVGTSFSVNPTAELTPGTIAWGDSFNVVQQIKNDGQGDAPPTRARIVLTPAGATPGGYNDVTIGNIAVPAIPAFQSTNVVQSVTLPPAEPSTLAGATRFTISIVQDGDFLTQPIYPRMASQGVGLDQGPIGIAPGPQANTPVPSQPDLAPASVVVSQNSLSWGQQFQVGTVIQNVGQGNAGPFRVRFVATGLAGDLSHGVFLGDTTVTTGLMANSSINVLASVQLPAKLPYGSNMANPAYARIYAIIDPEDVVDQSMRSNNMASSAPVLLSVLTADGSTPATVTTYPQNIYNVPVLATQAAKQVAKTAKAHAKLGAAKPASSKPAKKHKPDFLASLSESVIGGVEKQIKALPTNVNKLLNRIGVAGKSAGTTGVAATAPTSAVAAPTTAAANNGLTIGNSGFGGNTSGGGFGATPT